MTLRLNLHLRLGIIYFSAVLFFSIAAYLTARAFTAVTLEANAVIALDAPVIRDIGGLRQKIDAAVKAARIAMAGQESISAAHDKLTVVAQSLNDLRRSALSDEIPFLDKIISDWNAIGTALNRMTASPGRIGFIFQKEVLPLLGSVGQAIDGMEQARRSISFYRVQKIQDDVQQAHRRLLFYAFLIVLTGVGLAWGIRRYVLRPLRILTRATDRVARGDFEHPVMPLRDDEIGDLFRNFEGMTRQLAKSEQMKKEFVSMVAHELRTPVAVIKGYVEILGDPTIESSEKEKIEYMEAILREAGNLKELTADLFDVARAKAGVFRVEPVLTDVRHELAAYLQPFEYLAQEKRIQFAWNVSGLPKTMVDMRRLGQSLRNLVTNAFKFTPRGGRIDVTGRAAGEELVFEVRDNGPGIPPQELENIFTRYYQVKVKEGMARGGTGLGLAIVREIALAHGGTVVVESEVGKGTCFRITLPIRKGDGA